MSITAANASIQLSIATVFPTPQQLQGFSIDDVFDAPSIKQTEVQMGVDGQQSAGFVFVSKPITFHFLADSPSIAVFDEWASQNESNETAFIASGIIVLDNGAKVTMINGSLTDYMWLPPAKKLLMPVAYTITFGKVIKSKAT
jgi:hypothetical protein